MAQERFPPEPVASPRRAPIHAGLRLQIVLALAGLMVLAFVPLFFAVASLARATVLGAREQAERSLVGAIAAHVAMASTSADALALPRALREHVAQREVLAACFFGKGPAQVECAGPPTNVTALANLGPRATPGLRDASLAAARPRGDFRVETSAGVLVCEVNGDAASDGGATLVRLVALYMTVFALALLVFANFALTRLIVQPLEGFVAAADRVANGARTLRVPRAGPRELVDLGASVRAMAHKLMAEEAKLRAKVEELTETTRRLTHTQAQLVRSERMASVGQLAAGLAHEIGNPLAALVGLQDLLLEGDLPLTTQRDFVERMRGETERIQTVVRDLLDFARPETVRATAGDEAFARVRSVFDGVLSLVGPQKPFRALRFHVDCGSDVAVAFPARQLTQVVLNMVLNAAAALARPDEGEGGEIRLRAAPVGDASVRIEIEDDGPGVAEAIRDRLFEPFVTTKEIGQGTGLGLAVCRGLIEAAGGQVGLDPSYRDGARFYVVLPAAAS